MIEMMKSVKSIKWIFVVSVHILDYEMLYADIWVDWFIFCKQTTCVNTTNTAFMYQLKIICQFCLSWFSSEEFFEDYWKIHPQVSYFFEKC